MNPDLGIRFEVIYKDVHLVEVRISGMEPSAAHLMFILD